MITAGVVLLGLVVLLQLGLLLQRHLNRPAPEPRWNPADEMEAMQSRINRMFEQAFQPTVTISKPPAAMPLPPTASRGSAASSSLDDPFQHMRRIQRQIDAMFAASRSSLNRRETGFDEGWAQLEITPGFSIQDTDSGYIITVNLPGVEPSGIHISLNQSILELLIEQDTSTRTTTPGGDTLRESRQTSRFERHLRLPGATANPAEVQAVLEKGVLKITVPKAKQSGEEKKDIKITTTKS